MRKLILLSFIPLALLVAYFLLFRDTGSVDVLVFSKTEGFRHASIEPGIEAIEKMGREHGFRVEATEDAAAFKEQVLRDFNVVVFLNTTGDVLNEAQQIELRRFVQAGGGFVGVHAAADTEYDWPWYNDLVGAWFDGHPNDPNVREGTIHVVEDEHESTEMLPAEWTRSDEWYDYREFKQGEVTVLLDVDERTYKRPEENPSQAPRPIAWYRDFDGGRTFYTGLGHTSESYEEPLFLEHLLGGIRYVAGEGRRVDYNNASVAPAENRFTQVVLAQNLAEPVELALLPDGRVVFIERRGDVHVYDPEREETLTVATLDVHSGHEDGLIGLAADPNFADNHWLYLFYSPAGDEAKQHVSRFILDGDRLDLASEKVVLEIPTQREECCHSGGSLAFGPEGLLFVGVGDNTNPHASDGYAPIDEREGRSAWDAQRSAGNTDDLRGKILRIRPEADGTYSVPEGNLFAEDGSEGRPEIYVMGNRNPYRLSVDAHTGWLYWGEVGPDAGEDSSGRGPKGYDEINQARAAGNYGWPYLIADNKPYHEHDFAAEASGRPFDPKAPRNDSPNNTGARTLPPAQPAMIWYPYDASQEFPLVGDGARTSMAGPVFHADDVAGAEGGLPEYYDDKLFIYEWMRGWMMAVTLDENGDFARMEPFMPSTTFSNPIDVALAPNGMLYVLEYGPLWFTASPEARLSRIEYVAGNRAPVARIAADRIVGAAPLTVAFSGAGSVDFDGDSLAYAWTFEEGAAPVTGAAPTFTYEEPGTYRARLAVTDPEGETAEAQVEVLVGNEVPQVVLAMDGNRSFYWDGVPIDYAVSVSDAEDGSVAGGGIAPEDVVVTIDYLPQGADLIEPALGHQALMESSTALVGKRLMEGSDCAACHQQDEASVGPSYRRIAERYQGEEGAAERLTRKVIEGGSGAWGDLAMAPHPQLSRQEAAKMVEYVMSLAEGAEPTRGLPLEDAYLPTGHRSQDGEGSYVLMATYTDRGGSGVGPLTAREVVTLRPPHVAARDYAHVDGGGMRFVVPEGTPGGMAGQEIFLGMHGAGATYAGIDLTDVAAITGTFGLAPTHTTGGWVDVYLDSREGEQLGTFEVRQRLTDFGAVNVTVPVDDATGKRDLVFVYRNEEEDGLVAIGISFAFRHQDEAPTP